MRFCSWRAANRLLLGILTLWFMRAAVVRVDQAQDSTAFAARIAQLSEPGGYFDTDNLISNESSYLHVVPALRQAGITGGAYVGVGPDQNFSYIAQVKPAIAFILDVRRDNLLLHLLFKALFQLSGTRIEYLSFLLGRPAPGKPDEWRQVDIERLVAYVNQARQPPQEVEALRQRIEAAIRGFGVPLAAGDLATIRGFHERFVSTGLKLQFQSLGRAPQGYYPTYGELLLETDLKGRHWSFLASEDDFQFVRSLQQRDLVLPIVGDFAGPSALMAIGKMMTERGDRLTTFYASNVELYLFRQGTFSKFIDNLSHLPRTNRSLLIRSVFFNAPSSSFVQPVDELVQGYAQGRFHSYRDVINR